MLVNVKDLAEAIADHRADPFPESVEKGEQYGEVDAVMIGADIWGWATTVSSGGSLSPLDLQRLTDARDKLARSISFFPVDARPFYQGILAMADLALAANRILGET
jgi:hypothetical protein